MIVVWCVLALVAGAVIACVVTLRYLPVILARMPDAARERLLDRVEAIERAEAD